MEIWKFCWNCKHETPQIRSFFKMFPRPLEGFTKKPETGLGTSFWTISFDAYQFCECRKCEAPILHIDAYEIKSEFEEWTEELQILNQKIKEFGYCDKYKYQSNSYPNFNSILFEN